MSGSIDLFDKLASIGVCLFCVFLLTLGLGLVLNCVRICTIYGVVLELSCELVFYLCLSQQLNEP